MAAAPIETHMPEHPAPTESDIEIRIDDISQLFHSLDPFPFRERDLDKDAEEFIVSWARELPADRPLRIVVHLPQAQASLPEAHEIGAAITGYFGYRARIIGFDLKELFRVGRRALAIGGQLETGTCFMNRCDYLDPALAWTGVKDSGRGCTLSRLGLEAFTRPKSFHFRK